MKQRNAQSSYGKQTQPNKRSCDVSQCKIQSEFSFLSESYERPGKERKFKSARSNKQTTADLLLGWYKKNEIRINTLCKSKDVQCNLVVPATMQLKKLTLWMLFSRSSFYFILR